MPGFVDDMARGNVFAQSLVDQSRKERAFNALRRVHGDVAGDPDRAQALQTYEGDRVEQERAAGLSAVRALKSLPPEADMGQAFDQIVAPNARTLGLTPEQLPRIRQAITTDRSHLDAFEAALTQPSKAGGAPHLQRGPDGTIYNVGADGSATPVTGPGGQPLVSGDFLLNARGHDQRDTQLGIANTNAATNARKADTGRINALAPSKEKGVGLQVQGTDANGNPVLSQDYAQGAPGTGVNGAPRLAPGRRDAAIRQAQMIASAADNTALLDQTIETAVRQVSPFTAGTGTYARYLGGAGAANLRSNLMNIEAQVVNNWISAQRHATESGNVGLGRVLQSEIDLMKHAFGSLEQDQSPKQLIQHLRMVQLRVKMSNKRIENAYAQEFRQPYTNFTGEQQAPSASAPQGGAPLSDEELLKKYGGQ